MNKYQELFKNEIIKNFEISDGLVDFEGFNAYECDVKKVVKAIWVYKTECDTFEKYDEDSVLFRKFWDDYVPEVDDSFSLNEDDIKGARVYLY